MLEGHAIEVAASRFTDEDVEKVQRMSGTRSPKDDMILGKVENGRFHSILGTLRAEFMRICFLAFALAGQAWKAQLGRLAILQPLKNRDKVGAREALCAHLENFGNDVMVSLVWHICEPEVSGCCHDAS